MTLAVQFTNVSRQFGEVKAVDRVSIDIQDGEFFSMLGPSGSGKTTCLRLIAGFEQPSAGSIRIHGEEAAGLPPYQRDVNTVFQDYALFPHMNVRDNVAYGLKVKGVGKGRAPANAPKKPSTWSPSAATASASRCSCPAASASVWPWPAPWSIVRVCCCSTNRSGALDLKLREQMQSELKKLQRQLGITFIFVTHDQTEALSMSDRVAVFNKGRIEQVDTPAQPVHETGDHLRRRIRRHLQRDSRRSGAAIERQSTAVFDSPGTRAFRRRPVGQPRDRSQRLAPRHSVPGQRHRYELKLENGQTLNISQANNQWLDTSAQHQTGQRLSARWAREAMIPLHDTVVGGV